MRHALVRLTGLLIVLMLVLTGCNLIGVDPIMQLDEDLAALKKQYSGVVASYDGGEITQEDVMGTFNSQYSYMSQMYSMYGMSMTADNHHQHRAVRGGERRAERGHRPADESRGLKLDDEKLAEVQAEADEHYQEAYEAVYANADRQDRRGQAPSRPSTTCTVNGYTKEALYNMELATANYELIEETLRDEITEVTDEQLQAAYDEKVDEDEETYADSPASFESRHVLRRRRRVPGCPRAIAP